MKVKLRVFGIFVATTGITGALFAAPVTAIADPNSGRVTVSGFANCREGAPKFAISVRIQAANGEAAEGTVNRVTQYYSMTFNRVPKNGERANAYVSCQAGATSWGKTFTLARPSGPFTIQWLPLIK
ncbi:hypothetical protein [Streptomyces zaehneri]|uniref:hypothetical protein n=1 Tax=Streptomyces zaehneri TaxID=3051180 RepID=UPI0028D7BB18|nr:hypothetical protein [Streptomyces sp. DSM 40713]